MCSNSITAKSIRLTSKQSIYVIRYKNNSDCNSDNNKKFIDIDLLCNKLSIRLLANNFITYIKKRRILERKDKSNEFSKVKAA